MRLGSSLAVLLRGLPAVLLVACATLAAPGPARADELNEAQQLLRSGKTAEALARTEQGLASRPRDPGLRFLKGVILAEQNKAGEAIAHFTRLAEDHPDLPEPYNNMAVLYASQGQYDKARTALEMAIRTNPSYGTAYENLGDVYARLASQAYARALQVEGGSPAVAPKLALIRELFSTRQASAADTRLASAAPAPAPRAAAAAARATPPAQTPPSPAPATPSTAAPSTVPPTAPTAAPTAPSTHAVASAGSSTPAAGASGDARQEVEAAVRQWAQAWSRKDLPAYFAAYAPDYPAQGAARKSWESQRKARIANKRSISVELSALQVEIDGDRARVRFRQDYDADALKISSRKTLEMRRVDGRWVIQKESTGS